jgi:hypothetical protein
VVALASSFFQCDSSLSIKELFLPVERFSLFDNIVTAGGMIVCWRLRRIVKLVSLAI